MVAEGNQHHLAPELLHRPSGRSFPPLQSGCVIRYTAHAKEKFEILRRHGFLVHKADVEETILHPDIVDDQSRAPLVMAQRKLDPEHALRVICREEEEGMKVIVTFYPGRVKQYVK